MSAQFKKKHCIDSKLLLFNINRTLLRKEKLLKQSLWRKNVTKKNKEKKHAECFVFKRNSRKRTQVQNRVPKSSKEKDGIYRDPRWRTASQETTNYSPQKDVCKTRRQNIVSRTEIHFKFRVRRRHTPNRNNTQKQ